MPEKQTREEQGKRECESKQGIIVPLDLPECERVSQGMRADGRIEVQVRARKEREVCPICREVSEKIHDTRKRVKRENMLRIDQISLIVHTRRCRCATCRRPFTETESACGREKRTTKRCRHQGAKQAGQWPIPHGAQEMQGGTGFVHDCLCAWREEKWGKKGRPSDDRATLPTPSL